MSRQHINSVYYTNKKKVTSIYSHPDFMAIVEMIKNKFYFATLIPGRKEPKHIPNMYLFNIDEELVYNNFYNDFGPLNIACLYKYCHGVNEILDCNFNDQVVHYTSMNAEKRANAAYLIASYAVLYLNKTPEEVYKSIVTKNLPSLRSFQDVSIGFSLYQIRLIENLLEYKNYKNIQYKDVIISLRIDCLKALNKAASLGFFNFEDFNVCEYEKYEQMRHGDLNWIVPQKFLAFLGPNTENGSISHYPEKYLNYFMKNDVAAVIRLNKISYESFRFTNAGLLHYEMFFPDGTVPPKKILSQFLHVAETTKGAIAVHCKAGLGRTGTLIAAYLMKHYRISAKEAIAWLRICRPGSVIGHQQSWLENMENSLWREGQRYRYKCYGDENFILHHKTGIYSKAAKCEKQIQSKNYVRRESENITKNKLKVQNNTTPEDWKAQSLIYETLTRKVTENQQFKVENINRIMTQGDKLNEIKIKRKQMCDNTIFD